MGEWVEQTGSEVAAWRRAAGTDTFRSSAPGGGLASTVERIIQSAPSPSVLRVIAPVIDDPAVRLLLCEARSRGVIVKCLTSLTDPRKGVVTKGWDASQDLQAHHETIRILAKAGVLLRSPSTTPHAKLLHLDGVEALFGSANLTRTSLRGNALETGVLLGESKLMTGLKDAFDAVWASCNLRMIHHSGAVSLDEKLPDRPSRSHPLKQEWDGEDELRLVMSHPGGRPAIAAHLAEALELADREVILAALSLFATDAIPLFGPALERCLERGVTVWVVVRPEHFTTGEYPDPSTLRLIEQGMQVLGVTGLHAKGFLIDRRCCGIQSANFSPYSLDTECVTANWEMALVGPADHPMLSDWAVTLQDLANQPTHRFLRG